jgi:hypothetical protein
VPTMKDAVLARAKSTLLPTLTTACTLDFAGENRLDAAEAFELSFRYSYQTAEEPENRVYLLRFPCDSGAYNTSELYFTWQKDVGFEPLTFAMPDLDFTYEDDESTKLKAATLRGFVTEARLVNSEFDATAGRIAMYSKWRGLGDASSNGSWVFREGRFVLDAYEVDPTYNGEMDAISVVRAGKPVALP